MHYKYVSQWSDTLLSVWFFLDFEVQMRCVSKVHIYTHKTAFKSLKKRKEKNPNSQIKNHYHHSYTIELKSPLYQ